MELLIYSGSCAAAFTLMYVASKAARHSRWRLADGVVVAWGMAFTVTLWMFNALGDAAFAATGYDQGLVGRAVSVGAALAIPGLLTSALLWWATSDRQVGIAAAIATLIAACLLIGGEEPGLLLAPVAWNGIVAAALFGLWPRLYAGMVAANISGLLHRKPVPGACAACGYPLVGLPQGVCPECGTPAANLQRGAGPS